MEEDEHSLTDRELQFAMFHQKLSKMRRHFSGATLDGDVPRSRDDIPAEMNGRPSGSVQSQENVIHPIDCHDQNDTDNINQIIGSNSPETCLSYLKDVEREGDVHSDGAYLTRLLDLYSAVFSRLPLRNHCHNESYAKMRVRFAELNAIQSTDAETYFNMARSLCQGFAFVHIAHAQFEHSQGNTKKGAHILQVALELNAKPRELLEAALQSLQSGQAQPRCSEEKENISLLGHSVPASAKKGSEFKKVCRISDGTDDLQLSSISCTGRDSLSGGSDDQLPGWRSSSLRRRVVGLPGRVPLVPISIPELDGDSGDLVCTKRSDAVVPSSLSRQTPGSSVMFGLSSAKKGFGDGDVLHLKPPALSPEMRPGEDLSMVDSTTTLLHRRDRRDASRMEDTSCNFKQILSSNSPESCRGYLLSLERRGDPHGDHGLLTKLRDCYKKVLSKLPIGRYSSNQSYAKMLVRYAELIGMEDPDDARDQFTAARCYCKGFAFVHIAYAQFELSQGNMKKAASILQKAQSLRASPAQQLEEAVRNLNTGHKQLLPPEEAERPPETQTHVPPSVAPCVEHQDFQIPVRVPVNLPVETPTPASKEPSSGWKDPSPGWKVPSLLSLRVSPEEKRVTPPPPDPVAAPRPMESQPAPSLPAPPRQNPPAVYQTPKNHNNYKDPYANSCITPVVKRDPGVAPSAARRPAPAQQPCTPVSQLSYAQTPQGSNSAFSSNESITIKGKQFFILKMIGRGGSSKVYQVLDHKKQLFAIKYVNLEEADAQTVESYKNEIEHLNHLQQYSDQIIKLYDYEISNSYIYMLMECGNLDLNTWLRSRKTVNSLERKFYWKNMLDAVHTIHKHGIVHSDLKPANFVIVNATLKLIDFGIANRIQPDVTSIMKDSQVGTLNYMPPEAIKDTSSKPGKASSKISPKGDVWSLGCILYCMTYGKTPFQSITNQFTKLHAIIDPTHQIDFPDIAEKDLHNVLMRCLVRDPRKRISIAELLDHPYLQLQPQRSPETEYPDNSDLRRILTDLAALQSPNSIVRAANNLAKMCNSGRKLDVAECVKSSSQPSWKM